MPGGQLKTRKGQSGWADGCPDRHPNNESEGKRKWGLGPAFVLCFVTNSCCQASHADLALEWCKKTKVNLVSSGERGGGSRRGGGGGELKGRPKQLMCFLQAGNWAVAPLESVSLKPSRLGAGSK